MTDRLHERIRPTDTIVLICANRLGFRVRMEFFAETQENGAPCIIKTGAELCELLSHAETADLWRECDDGHDDELIRPSVEVHYHVFDGDRFYTAAREINGA